MSERGIVALIGGEPGRALEAISLPLEQFGFATIHVAGVKGARALQRSPVDAVLLLRDGAEADLADLATLQAGIPGVPVIVLAPSDQRLAVRVKRAQAFSFLAMPCDPTELIQLVKRAAALTGLRRQLRGARLGAASRELVGASSAMRRVRAQVVQVAPLDVPVLIEGETGTGKDVVAHALHAASRRAGGPFVAVDCAALPESLVEAELFGNVGGAFTGAATSRRGKFSVADGGTLFLDEIMHLPLSVQPRLLRALDTGEICPLGADRAERSNFRLVTAATRSLRDEAQAGRFRLDLVHRLEVVTIAMPPLRDHREDIPELVEHLLRVLCVQMDRAIPTATPAFLDWLRDQPWAGNVRELRNVLERSLILKQGGPLQPPTPIAMQPELSSFHEAKRRIVDAFEREYLQRALAESNGTVADLAARVGVSLRQTYNLLSRHGLGDGRG
ncbi:MAG: sigma-54-dependent Fis family transcriptional regulator [Candidatus Schekmanbacteria bacterium]|nr:sigma-54-dependent Fis family transcriptional regulator [Candidatus Schekmanbacteria bacterium]